MSRQIKAEVGMDSGRGDERREQGQMGLVQSTNKHKKQHQHPQQQQWHAGNGSGTCHGQQRAQQSQRSGPIPIGIDSSANASTSPAAFQQHPLFAEDAANALPHPQERGGTAEVAQPAGSESPHSMAAAVFSASWRKSSAKSRTASEKWKTTEKQQQQQMVPRTAVLAPEVPMGEQKRQSAESCCSNSDSQQQLFLSELSQEVLAQIIRQFPFASSVSVTSCPTPAHQRPPLSRTLSQPEPSSIFGPISPDNRQAAMLAALGTESQSMPVPQVDEKAGDSIRRRKEDEGGGGGGDEAETDKKTGKEMAECAAHTIVANAASAEPQAASFPQQKSLWQTKATEQLDRIRRVASNLSAGAISLGGSQKRRERPKHLPLFSRAGEREKNRPRNGANNGGALGRLCRVSVDTMAITALPLDCWLKERLKSWVQLSGHQGTIVPASNLSLWKKLPQNNRAEAMAYVEIMRDPALRGVTPKFYREIVHRNEAFIEIQDLLAEFPNVECRALMDIKLGTRTFLQCEVANQHKRPDLYRKMVEVAPEEPTEEERRDEAITKMRYMQFRERRSTSASLGFRIEAAQMPCGPLQKDFKRLATSKQVRQALMEFFGANRELIRRQLLARLKQIRTAVANSRFFRTHEVVGSSLLLVHDGCRAGAWLIDFAKSHPWDQQPASTQIPELRNNGYVTGLDSLVDILEPVAEVEQLPSSGTTPVEHHGDNMAPGRQMRCREEA